MWKSAILMTTVKDANPIFIVLFYITKKESFWKFIKQTKLKKNPSLIGCMHTNRGKKAFLASSSSKSSILIWENMFKFYVEAYSRECPLFFFFLRNLDPLTISKTSGKPQFVIVSPTLVSSLVSAPVSSPISNSVCSEIVQITWQHYY